MQIPTGWAALGGLAEGNGFLWWSLPIPFSSSFELQFKNRNALGKTNREGKDKRREKRKGEKEKKKCTESMGGCGR